MSDRPAGWYPHPGDPSRNLYWDGERFLDAPPGERRQGLAPPVPAEPEMSYAEQMRQAFNEPPDYSRRPSGGAIVKWVVVLAVAGLVVWVATRDWSGGPEKPDGRGAQVICHDFVKDALKSPSTADFSDESHAGKSPIWTVRGQVDSENSFGAVVRSSYVCTVKATGAEEWRLVEPIELTPR